MLYDLLLKLGAVAFMVIFFGLCIFIHELGHFLVAKWRGLHIIAFSIGFRKVWWKKINGVEYRIGCIPVGGYVDLPQIDASGDALDENGNVLPKAKPFDRMLVAFSGPLFNMLFGLLLGVVIWIHGMPQDTPELQEITVESIQENSPEYKAGLRKDDVITELNGEKFSTTWHGFINKILFTIGDVNLKVRRGDKTLDISYKPAVNKAVSPEEEIAYPFFFPLIPVQLYPRPDSPAAKAGIRKGDHLVKVNNTPIFGLDELEQFLMFSDGKPLTLTVIRDGKTLEFKNVVPDPVKGPSGEDGVWLLGFVDNPIIRVTRGLPMEKAGLQKGDRILEVEGKKVDSISEIQDIVRARNGQPVSVRFERDGKPMQVTVTPRFVRYTTLGVDFATILHPNPFEQLEKVMVLTWNSLRGIGYSIGNSLRMTEQHTTIKPKHMSGPIGIGKYLYLSVYRGSFVLGLSVVVIITFNLGIINLLPIPILDGGHIVLALLEMIFRRPVSRKILEPISITFITLLIGFMIFVSFYDVKKLVTPALKSIKTEKPPDVPAKTIKAD